MKRAKDAGFVYAVEAVVRRIDEWAKVIEFSKQSDDEIRTRPPEEEEIDF